MPTPLSHQKLALCCMSSTNVSNRLIQALRDSADTEDWRVSAVTSLVQDALKQVVDLQTGLHQLLAQLDCEKQTVPAQKGCGNE